MKTKTILFFSLIICFSCVANKKDVIRYSTIKLEGKNTNIRECLDIDGVFDDGFIFFDDGSYVENIRKPKFGEDKITNLSDSIFLGEEKSQLYWGWSWGVYTLQNDTIIVQVFNKGTWYSRWSLYERRYKIVDRRKIELIYVMSPLLTEADKRYLMNQPNVLLGEIKNTTKETTFHFVPADGIPAPNNWLKEQKWIWRNESDWEEYMEKIEQMKANKK